VISSAVTPPQHGHRNPRIRFVNGPGRSGVGRPETRTRRGMMHHHALPDGLLVKSTGSQPIRDRLGWRQRAMYDRAARWRRDVAGRRLFSGLPDGEDGVVHPIKPKALRP
jgi:hypothetical protein